MSISASFHPVPAVLGGALLGATCCIRIAAQKRLSGLETRSLFLPGVMIGGAIASALRAASFEASAAPTWRLMVAAALMGVGVPLGGGCTSGNGVQGLGCASKASFVNVVAFMAAAAAVASLTSASELILPPELSSSADYHEQAAWPLGVLGAFAALIVAPLAAVAPSVADLSAGVAFACALALSGMTKPSKVVGLSGMLERASPIQAWARRPVEPRTVLGGLLFGAGWGLGGVCPCPAFAGAGAALFGGEKVALLVAATMLFFHRVTTSALGPEAGTASKKP